MNFLFKLLRKLPFLSAFADKTKKYRLAALVAALIVIAQQVSDYAASMGQFTLVAKVTAVIAALGIVHAFLVKVFGEAE
jgi:hypothetical protein